MLIYLLILTYLVEVVSLSVDDVVWVQASEGETAAEACSKQNLKALFTLTDDPLVWDADSFNTVVTTILNLDINSNVNNSYGIKGCCAPGLWCDDDGCFTQSYGPNFINYGWLNNDDNSVPVYACFGDNDGNGKISFAQFQGSNNGRIIEILGNTFTDQQGVTDSYIYQESCSNVEICNCVDCSSGGDSACSIGERCYHYEFGSTDKYNCFMTCVSDDDESCPCGQICTEIDSGGTFICLPPSTDIYVQQCEFVSGGNSTAGRLSCQPQRAFQSAYEAEISNRTFDISISTEGDSYSETINVIETVFECSENSDCFDGNICTIDSCDSATKLCSYSTSTQCSSMPLTVTTRQAPYMYYSYYRSSSLASVQSDSVDFIVANGDNMSGSNDGVQLESITLPFSLDYFGNTVSTGYISSTGALVLPPVVGSCESADQCYIFTSGSNIIAPWFSSWYSNSSEKQIYTYESSANDTVFGVTGDGLHILYNEFRKDNVTNEQNTFAISLYSDSSIRLSYIDVNSDISAGSDFSGLWGSFASDSSYTELTTTSVTGSFLRYHLEQPLKSQIQSGSEIVYCPFSTIAFPVDTCLTSGDTLTLTWTGIETCSALGGTDVALFEYTCSWGGGVEESQGTLSDSSLSCNVPAMDFADYSTITVEIIIVAADVGAGTVISEYSQNVNDVPGTKGLFSVAVGENNELARTPILVQYYTSAANKPTECGCDGAGEKTYDAFGVCGGSNSTADCAGVNFGSAVTVASCSENNSGDTVCAGGNTNVVPDYSCSADDNDNDNGGGSSSSGSSNDGTSAIVSQTIILLMIICCMTFITMALSYSIRRMMAIRALNESLAAAEAEVLQFELSLTGGGGAQRGLSEFECDALGQVTFTKAFYQKHLEQQALLHQSAGASSSNNEDQATGDATGGAAASETCDCAICLSEIEEGGICRVLPDPCGHIFHQACIDQWFKQSSACPMCKRSMRAILVGDDEIQVFNTSSTIGRSDNNSTPVNRSDGNRNRELPPIQGTSHVEVYSDDYGVEVRYPRRQRRHPAPSPPDEYQRHPRNARNPHNHTHPYYRHHRPPSEQNRYYENDRRGNHPQRDGYQLPPLHSSPTEEYEMVRPATATTNANTTAVTATGNNNDDDDNQTLFSI